MEDYSENVRRGIALLDGKLKSPLWRNPLIESEIRFYSTTKDVLGLIFQQYQIGLRVLGLDKFALDASADFQIDGIVWDRGVRQQAIYYGFCPKTDGTESVSIIRKEEEALSASWKFALTGRSQ